MVSVYLLRIICDTYFPRIIWAQLTLKPSKLGFFVPSLQECLVGQHIQRVGVMYGLRANGANYGKFEAFSVSKA